MRWLVLLLFVAACARSTDAPSAPAPNAPLKPTTTVCQKLFPSSKQNLLSFEKANLCAAFAWEKTPDENNQGAFTLKFYEWPATSAPAHVPPGVAVILWMPSMGHGSSPVKVALIEPDFFRATDVYFIMPGPWEIRVQIKSGVDVIDESTLAHDARF